MVIVSKYENMVSGDKQKEFQCPMVNHYRLDECRVMGPMSDSICSVLENENKLQEKKLLEHLIHNPLAPGKRTGSDTGDLEKRKL